MKLKSHFAFKSTMPEKPDSNLEANSSHGPKSQG